ncbi:RING-H2 finger protein ATL80 [Diospyros lotus]|uniref:RING-H2 finger protein ATL80 n=1 Tax=Diospyros lotus TaxID=55363 RepID=UPI00224F2F71|nr:RING-H2 finger protein ATL80 [Diospyros lotus]
MSRLRLRILGEVKVNSSTPPPTINNVDSDFVVIIAALLCALICVLGLVAVARCAWIRRLAGRSPPTAPGNKGLKKKTLNSLPKLTYTAEMAGKFSDCAICLADYVAGDEVRVLPQCGHGFHVACIDTWLGSHSSCPSCRQLLVAGRCQKCGGLPENSADAVAEARLEQQRQFDLNTFLP